MKATLILNDLPGNSLGFTINIEDIKPGEEKTPVVAVLAELLLTLQDIGVIKDVRETIATAKPFKNP